jgi:hypothetical protein
MLLLYTNGLYLSFQAPDKKRRRSLGNWLYAQYHPTETITSNVVRVKTLPSDKLDDCRRCNLRQRGEPATETKNRIIQTIEIEGKKYIQIYFKAYQITQYFDYSMDLYDLFTNMCSISSFFVGNGYMRCRFKDGFTCYTHQLALAYYQNLIDMEDVSGSVKRAIKSWGEQTIDHLNSDRNNNCSYNLSLMTKKANTVKFNLTGTVKPPCYLYTVVTKYGEYLLEVQQYGGFHGYYKATNVDQLIRGLNTLLGRSKSIFKNAKLNFISDKNGMINAPMTFQSDRSYHERDFEQDCVHANMLLSMPEQSFYDLEILSVERPGIQLTARILDSMFRR